MNGAHQVGLLPEKGLADTDGGMVLHHGFDGLTRLMGVVVLMTFLLMPDYSRQYANSLLPFGTAPG